MDELLTLNHTFCKVAMHADHPEAWHYVMAGNPKQPVHIWTNAVTNRRVYYIEQDADFDFRLSGMIVSLVCQGRTDRDSLMRFEHELAAYLGVSLAAPDHSSPTPPVRPRPVPRQQGKRAAS